ncbi:mannose-P-dolichol utilization defect 1 protein isoform X2 [Melanerpes formicivorus]|uniref:mannose-P-dolichol utilization defect 1 protein isoform X2 n=1 Tax=Melanerpes formicivorus TaxID=211600 RepID=UPI00358E45F6
MAALRGLLVPLLLSENCFDELVLNLHLLHVPCLKILLSKALGYAIVAGSLIVKLPQLLKVWGARSGAGLSLPSLGLELLALGGSVSYGWARGFPFSAWGEALFLLLQTLTLLFLIQHFGGHSRQGLVLVSSYLLVLGALLSPLTPLAVPTALQAANLPLVVLSRETGDLLLALTFATSAACNAVLLAQLLYYGGGPKAPSPRTKAD